MWNQASWASSRSGLKTGTFSQSSFLLYKLSSVMQKSLGTTNITVQTLLTSAPTCDRVDGTYGTCGKLERERGDRAGRRRWY